MNSAKSLLDNILTAFNSGTLNLQSARSLAQVSDTFLRGVRARQTTGAADTIWVDSLILDSDLQARAHNIPEQLKLANEAEAVAEPLAKAHPDDPVLQQQLYDATKRVGDATALSSGKENFQSALAEYEDAMKIARSLLAMSDVTGAKVETAEADVIDAHMKIGDIYKIENDYSDALNEYRAGLAACEAGLSRSPQSVVMLENRGKAHNRIAEAYREQKGWNDAEDEYRLAEQDQLALVKQDARDDASKSNQTAINNHKSNLASTYNHWGLLESERGELDLAQSTLRRGMLLQEELVDSDPTNPQWEAFLVPNYQAIARILDGLERREEASEFWQKSLDVRRKLMNREPKNVIQIREFATAAKALGEDSAGQDQLDAFRDAVRAWKRIVDRRDPPDFAKGHYDDLLRFAHAFEAAQHWRDASAAYLVAVKMANLNLESDPSDETWRAKADLARKGADDATTALRQPAGAPN